MKKLLVLLLLLSGCASTMNPSYQAYIQAASRPLVQVDVDEQGRVKSFIVGNPFVQQEKDHAGWRVAERAVGVVGVVGGIWAAGEFIMKPMFSTFGSFANAPNSITTTTTNTNTNTTIGQSGTGHSAVIGSGSISNATATPTIVTQPPPVIVNPSYPP